MQLKIRLLVGMLVGTGQKGSHNKWFAEGNDRGKQVTASTAIQHISCPELYSV